MNAHAVENITYKSYPDCEKSCHMLRYYVG